MSREASAVLFRREGKRRADQIYDVLCSAMEDPAFGLDMDSATELVEGFKEAEKAGYPFDRFSCALVRVLRRQMKDEPS